MRGSFHLVLSLLLSSSLLGVQFANGQAGPTSLQPGTPIERTLAAGQSHTYNISLEQDQFLHLVVDQRGIDVVVRAFSPAGRQLGEFDTPNGVSGPEDVTLIAVPNVYIENVRITPDIHTGHADVSVELGGDAATIARLTRRTSIAVVSPTKGDMTITAHLTGLARPQYHTSVTTMDDQAPGPQRN